MCQNNENVTKLKLTIFTIISFFFIIIFILCFYLFSPKYILFFYLTLWSFWMNMFYMISLTVCDYCEYFNKPYCKKFSYFLRTHFLKVNFSFGVGIIFLFWMLALCGPSFQPIGTGFIIFTDILLHGIIIIFVLFDIILYKHYLKLNYLYDIGIITIVYLAYLFILSISKYIVKFNPYAFLRNSDLNHVFAAGILFYVIILDGYVVYLIIGNKFFEKIDDNNEKIELNEEDKKSNKININNNTTNKNINDNIVKVILKAN